MNRPGSTSSQATGFFVGSGRLKCGESGPLRSGFMFMAVNRQFLISETGWTSTVQPLLVGMPVPSVLPPISLQVGGP